MSDDGTWTTVPARKSNRKYAPKISKDIVKDVGSAAGPTSASIVPQATSSKKKAAASAATSQMQIRTREQVTDAIKSIISRSNGQTVTIAGVGEKLHTMTKATWNKKFRLMKYFYLIFGSRRLHNCCSGLFSFIAMFITKMSLSPIRVIFLLIYPFIF